MRKRGKWLHEKHNIFYRYTSNKQLEGSHMQKDTEQENIKHFNNRRGWKDWDAVPGKKEYSFFGKQECSLQMSYKKFQHKQDTRSVKINIMS